MSNENPKIAIDSLLEAERDLNGLTVYPLTIARYALLELIESPIINKNTEFNTINIIPTFYVMTSSIKTLAKYDSKNIEALKEDAMMWSEDFLDVKIVPALTLTILQKIKDVNKVAPETVEDTSKKAEG